MGGISAGGGWFKPGDDLERAWDEAEAVLLAVEDLDAVMETIRQAESPVEARRALKFGFGFTGRQAALLLTLPVMAFTRSERRRLDEGRRDRMDLLADVTGVLPAVTEPEPAPAAPSPAEPEWARDLDRVFDRLLSSIDDPWQTAAESGPAAEPEPAPEPPRPSGRRSMAGDEDAASVLDEQIGELCDAIAGVLGVSPPTVAVGDDPRDSGSPSGALLDSCGVDDSTGLRTMLWHLQRSGLSGVEGLFPFSDPLAPGRAFDEQTVRFEQAMASGGLGAGPGDGATWASRLWPVATREGYGYAVLYREGPDSGSVWAYGGGEPLHRLWDSVLDLLVDLYQALTRGTPCDAALAVGVDGRVEWSDLS